MLQRGHKYVVDKLYTLGVATFFVSNPHLICRLLRPRRYDVLTALLFFYASGARGGVCHASCTIRAAA